MKKLLYTLAGFAIGLAVSFVLTIVVLWVYPFFNGGAGGDAMTRGILGTLIVVFLTPVLVVVGGAFGYGKAQKN